MSEHETNLEISAQNFSLRLDQTSIDQFIKQESEYYSSLSSLLGQNIVINQNNYGNSGILNNAVEELANLKKFTQSGDFSSLIAYCERAERFEIVIGQGQIGQHIKTLISLRREAEALWVELIFDFERIRDERVKTHVAPYRAAATGGPVLSAFSDLNKVRLAVEAASEARQVSTLAASASSNLYEKNRALFGQLEELYREKLLVSEPAEFWSGFSKQRTRAWSTWLFIFLMLIVAPISLSIIYWDNLVRAITTLTANGSSGISIAGLAIVTVPSLLYAWLLRNVSRLFLQNLDQASDAAYRKALAVTFLGLAENEKIALSDQDRALILNALFRPMPPNAKDEGPPMGLIDLIRNKGQ